MKSAAELVKHNHLCRECGTVLHASDARGSYCEETADHAVSGRCEACWRKLGEFWTIEWASAYGIEILRATHFADEGLARWYACRALRGLRDTSISLPEVGWRDLDNLSRESDGSFQGCDNRAWIIDAQQMAHFIQLNQERVEAKRAADQAELDAEQAHREQCFAEARSTNRAVEISRWMTGDCHSHLSDCSFDLAQEMAQPDGSAQVRYTHCF